MPHLANTPASPASTCCTAETQQTCCEPAAKGACCSEPSNPQDSCGCAAGQPSATQSAVRETYAAAAQRVLDEGAAACCPSSGTLTDAQRAAFGHGLYEGADRDLPDDAVLASLGCGNPTAIAALRPGDVVLDLGSGGGLDVLLSARRVGPTGRAYGLDMTEEMLTLARKNQAEAGITNAEFLEGTIEQIPLADASVDVIISNCVINLSGDKPRALREAARVLRPHGRFAVSDVIADPDMDEATRADMRQWTGCIAGALTAAEFSRHLADAGFADITITPTHRVHDQAASAIVRATKP
jgi:arsenite methyltransferase